MKLKIFVKKLNPNIKLPEVIAKGDWVDLCASETMRFKAPQSGTLKSRTVNGKEEKYRNVVFDTKLIPLGIAVLLPNGFEAHLLARSSTAKGMGLIQANGMGIIDGGPLGYNGPTDEWKFSALAIRDSLVRGVTVEDILDNEGNPTGATKVIPGERICQFRIELSQKATFWQKLKWFLCSGIEIIEVDELPNKVNRTGFGSTGK